MTAKNCASMIAAAAVFDELCFRWKKSKKDEFSGLNTDLVKASSHINQLRDVITVNQRVGTIDSRHGLLWPYIMVSCCSEIGVCNVLNLYSLIVNKLSGYKLENRINVNMKIDCTVHGTGEFLKNIGNFPTFTISWNIEDSDLYNKYQEAFITAVCSSVMEMIDPNDENIDQDFYDEFILPNKTDV